MMCLPCNDAGAISSYARGTSGEWNEEGRDRTKSPRHVSCWWMMSHNNGSFPCPALPSSSPPHTLISSLLTCDHSLL